MQKKIIISALLSVVVMLLGLGVVSQLSVSAEIQQSLNRNLELATITSRHIDYLLQSNLNRLYDVSLSGAVDLEDGDWSRERAALRTAFEYSIFSDGLFLLDLEGNIVLTYPKGQIGPGDLAGIPDVKTALQEDRPFLTKIYSLADTSRKGIFAFAPLKNKRGDRVGIIGGEISPTNLFLLNAVNATPEGSEVVIDLVDSDGTVISSNRPERVFECADRDRVLGSLIDSGEPEVLECHRCHIADTQDPGTPPLTSDMLAFSALQDAPWGVAVREPQERVYAASYDLKRNFLILGILVAISAIVLAVGLSRSIVNPIRDLTQAARRIARGELETPVRAESRDEIAALSLSFETMRAQLAESLEKIHRHNLALEKTVRARTRELQRNRERLALLLGKVMGAQEEERKRIARELHDETLQAATALGLSLDISSLALEKQKLTPGDLKKLKANVGHLVDDLNGLIRGLRPPMLDDLGLESAVRGLLDRHLAPQNIAHHLHISEECAELIQKGSRLQEGYDLVLFRIIQEAVTNTARHSEATRASVDLLYRDGMVELMVQDNGIGFDSQQIMNGRPQDRSSGFGILGLRERVALLEGEVDIESKAGGGGTLIRVSIPLPTREDEDGTDSSLDRR